MKICSSYKHAVTQQHCTAALGLARGICHCSVLLCKTGSQQSSCHCNYTCGDLPFIQACSDPTARHCSTGFGKRHFPLFSAGLQIRLTTALCHCNCTYEDLLFIQTCSDPTALHCSTGFGKRHLPLFSAALQNRLTAVILSLQLHLWRFALHTGLQ